MRYEEGYSRTEIHQKSDIIFRVKYQLLRIINTSSFKNHLSGTFREISSKLGLTLQVALSAIPHVLCWQGALTKIYYLSTDGVSNHGLALGGEVIIKWHGEHTSTFFSLYGSGTNSYAKINALLEGILYYHILGISRFQIQCESLLVISYLNQEGQMPSSPRKQQRLIKNLSRSQYALTSIFIGSSIKQLTGFQNQVWRGSALVQLDPNVMERKCNGAIVLWGDKVLMPYVMGLKVFQYQTSAND